jgi:hypothetical protein
VVSFVRQRPISISSPNETLFVLRLKTAPGEGVVGVIREQETESFKRGRL